MNRSNRKLGRRQFLTESAAAAAAFTAAFHAMQAQAAEEKAVKLAGKNVEPINFAMVGIGNQGSMLIDQATKQPGAVLKAVCDIRPGQAEFGLKYAVKGAKAYDNYEEMLEKEKNLQAVILATPLFLHNKMTLAAFNAGLHVYCEKMMAINLEQCKEMARAAKAGKKVLQFGHHRHYDPYYRTADMLINQEQALGTVSHVRSQWNRNGRANPSSRWSRPITDADKRVSEDLIKKNGFKDLEHLINWRLYKAYSRGLTAELLSHQVDVVNWFFRTRPIGVMGLGGIDTWKDGREVYDNIQVIFVYPKGLKFQFQAITTNQFDSFYEQFMGTDRTLVLSTGGGQLYHEPNPEKAVPWEEHARRTRNGQISLVLNPLASPSPDSAPWALDGCMGPPVGPKQRKSPFYAYGCAINSFFDCIRTGAEPACSAQVALNAAVACIRADEAMEKKGYVEIPASDYEL